MAELLWLAVELPVPDEVEVTLKREVGEVEEEDESVALEDPVVEGVSSDDGDALAQPLAVPDAVALPELDDELVLQGVAVDDRVAVDVAMAVKVPNDERDDVPVVVPVVDVFAEGVPVAVIVGGKRLIVELTVPVADTEEEEEEEEEDDDEDDPVLLEDPETERESAEDGDALAQPLTVPDEEALPVLDDKPVLDGVAVDDFVAVDVAIAV